VPLDAEAEAALRRELEPLTILHDVVAWAAARTPPARVDDVIVQDEFTHDVVVATGGARWLVFDTT
jgi:hypothetical protein